MPTTTKNSTAPNRALVAANPAGVVAIIPTDIEQAYRMAKYVYEAKLAPYGLDSEAAIVVAMMTGMELGIPPMRAVQNIMVVKGRPTIWGDLLPGVVRASGKCGYIRERIEGEGDEMVAVCEAKRNDDPGDAPTSVQRFSVADAKAAGLWSPEARITKRGKGGSSYESDNDTPWHRHPKRMLQMRARAFALRDAFADVLSGIHAREEFPDTIEDVEYSVVQANPFEDGDDAGASGDEDESEESSQNAPQDAQEPHQDAGADHPNNVASDFIADVEASITAEDEHAEMEPGETATQTGEAAESGSGEEKKVAPAAALENEGEATSEGRDPLTLDACYAALSAVGRDDPKAVGEAYKAWIASTKGRFTDLPKPYKNAFSNLRRSMMDPETTPAMIEREIDDAKTEFE